MVAIKFKFENASAQLSPMGTNLYALSNLWSGTRGKGHARGVMQEMVDFADRNNATLRLIAQRYGKPSTPAFSNKQLEEFYAKFGFVAEPGPGLPVFMVRYPSR